MLKMKRKWITILLIVTLILSNCISIWAKDLSKNELEDEYIEEDNTGKVLLSDESDNNLMVNNDNVVEEETNLVPEISEMEKRGFEKTYFTETIIGTLQSVNLNNFTVKIDDKDYPVGSDFDIGIATEILINYESKVIIALLRENEIVSMNNILEVVYLKRELSSDINNLIYSDGKIDTKQFKGKVSYSLAVREPYSISDLNKVSDKNLISLSLGNMYLKAYGHGLYFEKGGGLSPNKSSIEIQINEILKWGETKEYSFDIYVEDDYKPESVTQSLTMETGVIADEERYFDTLHIPVGNIDLQREQQEAKKAERNSTEEISKAVECLDGLNIAFDDTRLMEYFTKTEVNNIKKCVTLWVADIVASTSLVHNDDNGVINTIRKKTGLTDDDIISSMLKKMGVNENVLTKVGNTKATTQITAIGKDRKKYTIYYSLDLGYNAFKGTAPYAGSGTFNYYIMIDGRKQKSYAPGIIAYTDINTFVNHLQKIAENNIKSAYGEVWWKKADKVAEMIVGETVCKVLKKRTGGTFSDNVFTLFANQTTNYTKKISVHCPVDVYVYDADGNICGEIVDNIVDSSYSSIYMYVDGTEKYFYLTEDDYTVRFLGNDTGEMQYTVEEYSDASLLRRTEYHNILLSDVKEYYSSIPDAVYLDNIVYDPVMDTGDVVSPSLDSWQDSLEKRVSTNGIALNQSEMTLNIGNEYKLSASVMPENATNKEVEWISKDETIASISDEGVIKAIATGETTIQSMTVDGGFVAECRVIVAKKQDYPLDKPGNGSSRPSTGNLSNKPVDSTNDSTTNVSIDTSAGNSLQTDTNDRYTKQTTKAVSVKTGDNNKLILWIFLCTVSIGIANYKRKENGIR